MERMQHAEEHLKQQLTYLEHEVLKSETNFATLADLHQKEQDRASSDRNQIGGKRVAHLVLGGSATAMLRTLRRWECNMHQSKATWLINDMSRHISELESQLQTVAPHLQRVGARQLARRTADIAGPSCARAIANWQRNCRLVRIEGLGEQHGEAKLELATAQERLRLAEESREQLRNEAAKLAVERCELSAQKGHQQAELENLASVVNRLQSELIAAREQTALMDQTLQHRGAELNKISEDSQMMREQERLRVEALQAQMSLLESRSGKMAPEVGEELQRVVAERDLANQMLQEALLKAGQDDDLRVQLQQVRVLGVRVHMLTCLV